MASVCFITFWHLHLIFSPLFRLLPSSLLSSCQQHLYSLFFLNCRHRTLHATHVALSLSLRKPVSVFEIRKHNSAFCTHCFGTYLFCLSENETKNVFEGKLDLNKLEFNHLEKCLLLTSKCILPKRVESQSPTALCC